MVRRACRVSTLAAVSVLLVSCTGTDDTPPTTRATTPPSTTVESHRPTVAPPVSDPVDLRPHRRHSCPLLGADQLTDLDLPPQDFEGANVESGRCEWRSRNDNPDRTRDLYSLTVHVTGDPLGEAYRERNSRLGNGKPEWPLFEERSIRGLPAVVRAYFNTGRLCHVVVSTGNGQGITMTGSPGVEVPDLCDRMVTAAELVVDAARR